MIRKKIIFIPVIISMLAALFVVYSNVSAVNTSSSYFHGYSSFRKFDFCGSGSNSTLHRVLCDGVNDDQVSNGGAFSKSKFISYIESLLSSSESSNKIGASFIIHTMIGKSSPDGTTVPTADEINDWKARLNNGNIVVTSELYSYSTNSGYVESSDSSHTPDDKFYSDSGTEISWVFRDSGVVKYVIKKKCANPIGGFDGLPVAAGWSLSATSTANVGAANPGDTITWTHTLKNDGPTKITSNIHSNLGLSGFSNGWGAVADYGGGDSASGTAAGTLRTFTDTYKVVEGDRGQTLCEWVNFDPSNSSGGRDGRGTISCVAISSPVVVNDCNPIQIAVEPRTYSAVSHTAPDGSFYYSAAKTVPVTISTSVQTWGPTTSTTPIIATSNHTTGDPYTVTFTETANHVTGYVDHYDTRGSEILDTSGRSFNPQQFDKNGVEILDYSARSYNPKQYNWLYSGTTAVIQDPTSWQSSIGPCYDFALTAGVSSLSADSIESNSVVAVNPTVINQSYTGAYLTHTRDTQWKLTQLIVQPNVAVPTLNNTSSSSEPCAYYGSKGVSNCTTVKNGNGIFDKNGNNSEALATFYANIGDYAAGTKICFVFSVQPRAGWYKTNVDTQWNHSALSLTNNCVVVVKKPKVQVWGGDLYAKTGVSTSTSIKSINGTSSMFGSWVEYGIFSAGLVKGTASGAAFAGSGLVGYNSACNYSRLSFANVTEGNTSCIVGAEKIGYYNASLPNIDVAASFPIASSTPTVTSSLDNLQGTYTATGNVTITGGNIKKGQWIVINAPNANITISGNINYTDETLNSVMDIPQVVIIAGNINITDNVTNVDSWLMASGSLNTCSSVSTDTKLTINICNQELVINGPVSAGKIYLRRTAGSNTGAASGDPAEVINLRADAYLWSAARATSIGKVHTVYTTELPPRF